MSIVNVSSGSYNAVMTWLFSKRCRQLLEEGRLKTDVAPLVRSRIWKALRDFNESWSDTTDTGWNYDTSTLDQLPGRIEAELGRAQSDVQHLVRTGSDVGLLFDILELFHAGLESGKDYFQTRINQIMQENYLPWVMANGQMIPVDSSYIADQLNRSSQLLDEVHFHGALQEFQRARIELGNRNPEAAIAEANKAVESTIKEILGIERAKPGELYRKLVNSGLVPDYHRGFLEAFEKHVLRCVAVARNEETGVAHGRGPSMEEVELELADLAVNLSGALIIFLIRQHLKKTGVTSSSPSPSRDEDELKPDDLPF